MPFAVLHRELADRLGYEPFKVVVWPFWKAPLRVIRMILVFEIIVGIAIWAALPGVIPTPIEVGQTVWELVQGGILADLLTSLIFYLEAVICATIISLGLAYLSTLNLFRPIAEGWGKLRFLSMIGLPFVFTIMFGSVQSRKLALLTFSISVFLIVSALDVVDSIPREKFDLARTLRMGEWQVLWEVVILGRADVMIDIVRQNAAMGFMMLPFVEALFRSGGGIGVVLSNQGHHFKLAEVFAIQAIILIVGIIQDLSFGWIKSVVCPYASLLLERR